MTITATRLTQAAGAAAAAAGALFIAVQIGHPATGSFTTETTQWVVRSCAKSVMAVLALAGITGMYLRQYRKAGAVGLVGYTLFAGGYLALLAVEVIALGVSLWRDARADHGKASSSSLTTSPGVRAVEQPAVR